MRSHNRRGSTLVYACAATFALAAMVALGVDWGRVQLTKSELRAAADAAARYAVAGLQNQIDGTSNAGTNATLSVAQNKANGRAIVFQVANDMVIGVWNKTARTFTANSNLTAANAVKITLRCTAARGTAVPMTFLAALGRPSQDVEAVSIAMIDYSSSTGGSGQGRYEYFIPATSDPWLSGMPSGTVASDNNAHYNPDLAGSAYTDDGTAKDHSYTSTGFANGGVAGTQSNPNTNTSNYANWGSPYSSKKSSPIQGGGMSVSPGQAVTFDGITGGANNMQSDTNYTADGNTDADSVWNVPDSSKWSTIYGSKASGYTDGTDSAGAENGIANVHAPINSVIGVFLDDNKPSHYTAPASLDFSTDSSRDFKSLSPKLRQPFFIGDGRTSQGEVQQFVPPNGATRLYIATMDEYEWSNNKGGFYVTGHVKGHIITVTEKPRSVN